MGNVNCLRCRFRHEDNGNCTAVGGFCTAVTAAHCPLLCQYLDTGLTPQEVHSMYGEWRAMMSVLNSIGGGYTRLRELAEADRAGRLVVLPCKVGAPVYTTHWWKDVKEKCTDSKGNSFYRTVHKNIIKKERFNPFGPDYEWLGKTVFLTREEAEKALEAMKQ